MRAWTLLLPVTTCCLAACFPRAARPPDVLHESTIAAGMARWPDATEASLEQGRRLFVSSCGACHGHPAFDAIPSEEWPDVIARMARKAELAEEERDLVLRFVLASAPR